MDASTAQLTLNSIAAAAVVAWSSGAWWTRRTAAVCLEPVIGEFAVPAEPHQVRRHLTTWLASDPGTSPFGGCIIDSATDEEVHWHRQKGRRSTRGAVRIAANGAGSRVAYGVSFSGGPMTGATVFLVLGAVAIVVLYSLLSIYAVRSEYASIRGQAMQMAQCVHFLWPPFLFAGMMRKMRSMLGQGVERTLKNAQFTDA